MKRPYMKEGDTVVCINNDDGYNKKISNITLYKKYTIIKDVWYKTVICDDNNQFVGLYTDRFISLKEYRKMKLKKLEVYEL